MGFWGWILDLMGCGSDADSDRAQVGLGRGWNLNGLAIIVGLDAGWSQRWFAQEISGIAHKDAGRLICPPLIGGGEWKGSAAPGKRLGRGPGAVGQAAGGRPLIGEPIVGFVELRGDLADREAEWAFHKSSWPIRKETGRCEV
jgi:hypothetical protein